ncbi:PAS domain-containing protein [Halorientalis regularis]|uniref:PAS domain S-box-containing protein n=1 Tax=Halorientalis regularis TaxID=660518 RepID=A0A1G7GKS5_9EURY|nr:PAS domain-containing protein [Halorientalis regularis]SDE88653.1 PAS domain S-box-containing protein [Halorientalis regularis]
MSVAPVGRLAVGILAAVVAGALAASLWPQRDEATARSLLGVALVLLLGSLVHLLVAGPIGAAVARDLTGRESTDLLWVVLGAATSVVAGGFWSLFAFRYTGRDPRSIRVVATGVGLLSLGSVTVAVRAATAGPSVALVDALTVGYLLVGFLATVGIYLLLWASVGANAFPVREPLVLSGGVVVLLSAVHVAQVFGRPVLYPASIALAGGSFLLPVRRYPIFETLPAARVAGRDRVVDELADGVVVADRTGTVQDLNPAAERLFGVPTEKATGRPVSAVLDQRADPDEVVASQEPIRLDAGGRTVEVTGSPVTDRRGRSFGTVLLCTDVTDRRTREEKLTLLSRFVADVVDDRMADVAADAAAVTDGTETADETVVADRVWTRTTDLTTLVAHAREIEQAIADGAGTASGTDLRPRIPEAVERAADGRGNGDVPDPAVEMPDEPLSSDLPPGLFETVVKLIVEDALERTVGRVAIRATVEPPTVRVSADPAASGERSDAARSDEVTIPVIRLAVEGAGGSVSVTRDGDERRVTAEFPSPEGSGGDC